MLPGYEGRCIGECTAPHRFRTPECAADRLFGVSGRASP